MDNLPLLCYLLLFGVAAFAPLRWSVVGFLLLSTIDLGSMSSSIGLLNTAKAMVLPVYMLWRFHAYAGHSKITAAPVAWSLLIVYVAIASSWSSYPAFAVKLVGHMIGSLVIAMMLIRASKSGYLRSQVVIPVTIGTLAMAAVHWRFLHDWGGEPERFTAFLGAQSFAAFAVALYAAALASKFLHFGTRLSLCAALTAGVIWNGSRMWMMGLVAVTLLYIFVSGVKTWVKILTFGATLIVSTLLVADVEAVMTLITRQSSANRIASALSALYQGDTRSTGLGTYKLRNELFNRSVEGIESGSVSQVLFGHGTCNGALLAATLNKNPDPNRSMHNEWLRTIYEWGIAGLILWTVFILSLVVYAIKGVRKDPNGYATPLLIYLPAFAIGLSGENFFAAAGNASSVGFLMLIAFASISHRQIRRSLHPQKSGKPYRFSRQIPSVTPSLSRR